MLNGFGSDQLLPNSTYFLLTWACTNSAGQLQGDTFTWGYTNSSSGTGPGFTTNWLEVVGGTPTPNASSPFIMQVNATQNSVVPEPSTYALLCISLGVVGYARKRMAKSE